MNAPVQLRRLGSYVLGRRVGVGGMATVFAARQEGPFNVARLVALKVSRADDFRRMFAQEAGILTRLEHPNVVRMYEVGESGGVIYIAMELVHGVRLSSLQPRHIPLPIALRIVCDAARGLNAAHQLCDVNGTPLGLIHQDVSPQNIMVGYDGTSKLLDFGVARLVAIEGSRTDTLRGKPSYLAPEQIKGVSIDRRADVFALGTVLHELLCGRFLFRRDTIKGCVAAILAGDIPGVREVRPEVPEPIATVARGALEREPSKRFATAHDLLSRVIEAASFAGVRIAEPEEVGTWVRDVAPPEYTPGQLEREIVEQSSGTPLPLVADVFDLPTVQPQRASLVESPAGAADTRALSRRSVLAIAVAVAVIGMGGGILYGARAPRSVVATTSPPAAPPATPSPRATASGAAPAVSSPATVEYELIETPAPSPARAVATTRTAGAPRAGSKHSAPPIETANPFNPPPATGGAELCVWSNVWGHVSVDGAGVGDSPLVNLPVSAGSHTVSVTTTEGTRQQTVTTPPGQSTKVRFVF